MKRGSLIVVGSGIKSIAHITLEARAWIRAADKVLYCLADPATEYWLREQNPACEDLYPFYQENQPRLQTYINMSHYIMQQVRAQQDVCVVFYGHPGVFSLPTHQAIAMARAEGYQTAMLPGVSAEDCLFADIGFDPAMGGCLSLEATELLLYRRTLSADLHVILWQVGSVGELAFHRGGYSDAHRGALLEHLLQFYPEEHPVFLYQASQYPGCPAKIEYLKLEALNQRQLTPVSTLYIPPATRPAVDEALAQQLGATTDAVVSDAPTAPLQRPQPWQSLPEHSRLADLLAELAEQPALLAAFAQAPENFARLYTDLTDNEREALRKRHPSDIRLALYQGSPLAEAPAAPPSDSPVALDSHPQAKQFCRSLLQHPPLAEQYLQAAAQAQLSAAPGLLDDYLRRAGYECNPQHIAAHWQQQTPSDSDVIRRYVDAVIHLAAAVARGEIIPPTQWKSLLQQGSELNHADLSAAVPHAVISR